MSDNFTPLDLEKIKKNDNGINTFLLVIVNISAFVLVVLLFVLIQKKINENKIIESQSTATQTLISPTLPLEEKNQQNEEITPTPIITVEEEKEQATESSNLLITPTVISSQEEVDQSTASPVVNQ